MKQINPFSNLIKKVSSYSKEDYKHFICGKLHRNVTSFYCKKICKLCKND